MTREEEKSKAWKEYANRISLYTLDHEPFTITDVENAYKAGYQKVISASQWHKVEEFPPEDQKHKGWSVKVIVINDGQYDIGFYDYKLKRWCVPGCIKPYFTNITHWQTFPELPKKE